MYKKEPIGNVAPLFVICLSFYPLKQQIHHGFCFFDVLQNGFLFFFEQQLFVVAVVFFAAVFADEFHAVVVGSQFCDENDHFLSGAKGFF